MQCKFEIDLKEPDTLDKLFPPYVKFRLIQLNLTPQCMTENEIDYQVDELLKCVEELRRKVKKKLKAAKSRHDKIIEGIHKKGNDDI